MMFKLLNKAVLCHNLLIILRKLRSSANFKKYLNLNSCSLNFMQNLNLKT